MTTMTERPARSVTSRRRLTAVVGALSMLASLVIFGGLWFQMAAGHDPALGAVATANPVKNRATAKRIVETTVIKRVAPAPVPASPTPARANVSALPSPSPTSTPTPVSTPVARPQPSVKPAPASAPAPAPVQTSTS